MTDKATNAIILVRVSTREQEEGHSIEAQKYRLVEYCQRKNLEAIKTFEIIESSSRGDRKQFKEMIKFAKIHRETIAIVADKVDRVQRRISEISLLEGPIKDGKIELHFRTEGYILTKDSQSHEKLVWGMNVLMAQSYVDSLSDNVKRSLDHKLRKGEWIGPAPIGYLNSRDAHGNSTVILDSSRAFIIKKLFEEYATGAYTLGSIVTMAKELGLRSKKNYYLNKTVLHRLMQQPFYYGEMLVKGEMWLHNYPPIITRETFMACKEVRLGWNKKPFKYGGKDFLFRGLITCATTGKIVTSEIHSKTYSNGKVDQWVYLAAWDPKNPNKKIYVREDEVLAKIEEIFKKIGIRAPELLKDTLEHLKNTNELKKDEHDEATASLKKEHTENEKRLNSLIDLRLNGELSTEEFQAKKQQLKDRQYEINRLLKIYDEADDKFTDTVSTLITLASEAYETFKGSEMPQKRKMIKFVFQNLKLRGKKLETSLRFPFDIFEKTTTRTEWRGVVNNFRTQSDTKLLIIQVLTLIIRASLLHILTPYFFHKMPSKFLIFVLHVNTLLFYYHIFY